MGRAATWVTAAALGALLAAGCEEGETGTSVPDPGRLGPEEPLRIVSLAPNVTEILFAMGLGRQVVGRSTHCRFPPEAEKIPAVGDTLHLNRERIAALRPTHAFVVTKRQDVVRALEGLGIRTAALECDTMAELIGAIERIGRETGYTGPAETVRDLILEDLGRVRRRVAGRRRPKVLFAFPMTVGSPKMMVAGRGSFVGDLLDVAGAENACGLEGDWPMVNPAQVIAMAPEFVIVNATGDDAAPDRLEAIRQAWAHWTSIPAVAEGKVILLREEFLTIPGPSVGLAAKRLASVIHPPRPGEED